MGNSENTGIVMVPSKELVVDTLRIFPPKVPVEVGSCRFSDGEGGEGRTERIEKRTITSTVTGRMLDRLINNPGTLTQSFHVTFGTIYLP